MSRSVVPRLAVTEDTLAVPLAHDLPQVSVLLVDDRPENLLALEAVLEPLGQRLVQRAFRQCRVASACSRNSSR